MDDSGPVRHVRWDAMAGPPRMLVVLCHGYSANALEMAAFVEPWRAALPHAAFMAPDGPQPFEFGGPEGAPGRQWFSLHDRTPTVLEAGAAAAAPALNAAIDGECARLGLDRGAVALAGFSQGAMMVLHTGLRRIPAPLGILAYSGALLATAALEHAIAAHPPVLLVHGELDQVVPFARGPEAEAALRRLGVPVQTVWCPGVEHWVDEAGSEAGAAFLRQLVPSARA